MVLSGNIARIEALLKADSASSIQYAALECRLAIEFICYQRLRVHYGQISYDDLRKWQPRQVIDFLIREVDPHAGSSISFYISDEPVPSNLSMPEREYYEQVNWIKVGEQIGVNPNKIGKLWNKLSNVALHVKMPKSQEDDLSTYGDFQLTKDVVREALQELIRINAGTLVLSGHGETISFTCCCNTVISRPKAGLRDNQLVNCFDINCDETYLYCSSDEAFERRVHTVTCNSCRKERHIPLAFIERRLKIGSLLNCECDCGNSIFVEWRLMMAQRT